MQAPDPLGERPRRHFAHFLIAALAGASALTTAVVPISGAAAGTRPAEGASQQADAPPAVSSQGSRQGMAASPIAKSVQHAIAEAKQNIDNPFGIPGTPGKALAGSYKGAPVATGTFAISPTVHRFLTADLGIRLGSSDTFRGGAYSDYVVVPVAAPGALRFGLPAGDAAPSFKGTELVENTRTGELTVAAVSDSGTASTLDISIPHASTSAGGGYSGVFEMPAVGALGGKVAFDGPVAVSGGRIVFSASAYDPASIALGKDARLDGGTHVVYSSAAGFDVSGTAEVGVRADMVSVAVSGHVTDNSDWSLEARSTTRESVRFAGGLQAEGGFAGTLAESNDAATFDLRTTTPTAWAPLPSTSELVQSIEYSDRSGAPEVRALGRIAVSSGGAGVLQAAGGVSIDLATNRASFAASGAGDGAKFGPSAVGGFSLSGNLVAAPDRLEGALTGFAAVGAGEAQLALSSSGVLDASTSGFAWSSVTHPSGTKAGARTASPAISSHSGTPGTFTVSPAVFSYLTSTLGVGLGTSGTLSGKVKGGIFTATVGAPTKVAVALPAGYGGLGFSSTTISIREKTGQLTLASSASASGGETAGLALTIPRAGTATASSYKATLTVGLDAFGSGVTLTGTSTSASFSPSGAIPAGTALTADSSFSGGMLTLSAGSLKVTGDAEVGTGPSSVPVSVDGSIANALSWTLMAKGTASSWQPIAGLVLDPDLSGTFKLVSGTVEMSLKATPAAGSSWIPGANTSMSLTGLSLTNATPGSSVSCTGLLDGDSWLDVSGDLTYSIFGASALTLPAQACVALGSTFYTTTTAATGSIGFGAPLFGIGKAQLVVSGDTASNAFSVTGTAVATFGSAPALHLALDFSSTGAFIGAVSLKNLTSLHVAGLNGLGVVWVSSEDVPVFVPPAGLPQAAAFHLRKGLSVTFTYNVDPSDVASLRSWGIPVPSTIQAVAALSADGFTIELDLGFGNGLLLFTSDPSNLSDPNALYFYLNDVTIAITLGAETTVELDGVGTLDVPAITGDSDSTAQSVQITVSGTVDLDSGNISVGIGLAGSCGGQTCPWTTAFGIPNLTISDFAAAVGVTFDSGIPTPTFGFSLDGVILPAVISGPIGLQADASITIDVNFDLAAPIVNLQLAPGPEGGPALLPLAITQDSAIEDTIVIDDAGLWFAPVGGTLANGTTVAPGIAVNFQALFAGVNVTVDAEVSPATLTVSATISVSPFSLGPVQFGENGQDPVYFYLNISPAGFVFQFESYFSASGFTYYANLDLTAVSSFAGASVALWVTAGLPSFLAVSGSLNGSISIDGSGNLQLSASGTGWVVVDGVYLGSASFSYSFEYGMLWQDITAAADDVAWWFENAYGWTDETVTYYLNQLEYSADNIASALQYAFSYLSPADIAQDLDWFVSQSSTVVAGALQYIGDSYSDIASVLQNIWGESESAIQGTLEDIGADAWDVLNALESVFTSGWDGTYYLSVTPQGGGVSGAPLFMDVSGGSQSQGAQVIDYPWDGGANQHWSFQSVGGGWAEIVNENSGQCLTIPSGDSSAGAPLQQAGCNGSPEELWYMDIVQQNLLGPSVVLYNGYDDLVADAAGASWFSANLDQWQANGGWNQEWTISPGIF